MGGLEKSQITPGYFHSKGVGGTLLHSAKQLGSQTVTEQQGFLA